MCWEELEEESDVRRKRSTVECAPTDDDVGGGGVVELIVIEQLPRIKIKIYLKNKLHFNLWPTHPIEQIYPPKFGGLALILIMMIGGEKIPIPLRGLQKPPNEWE